MKRERARQLLRVFRPGGQDASDPQMAEALRTLKRDPALAEEFAEQRRFDHEVGATIRAMADASGAPVDLRAALLAIRLPAGAVTPTQAASASAPGKIIRPPFWRAPLGQDWRARAAAAAVILLLSAATVLIFHRPAPLLSDLRRDLIANDWAGDPHLDFQSSDLGAIKTWISNQGFTDGVVLPTALNDLHLQGCRMVYRDGKAIPLLCFGHGSKHFHLFVIDHFNFPDLPPTDAPDFEKCGPWTTASWRHSGSTYVLTGMKNNTFVQKFRRDGRWNMSG